MESNTSVLLDLSAQAVQTVNQDPILGDTVLGSKFFNPGYLFNQIVEFFQQLFGTANSNSASALSFYHTMLFIFALFFLTIISYTVVRLFEIRKKERAHLKHEMDEYAHHHAEKENKLNETEAVPMKSEAENNRPISASEALNPETDLA